MFSLVDQALCQTDSLRSISVQSEREVLPDMNIRETVLKVVQGSPWAPTPRIANCNGVSRTQVWWTLHEEDW